MFELLLIGGIVGTLWWAAKQRAKRAPIPRPPVFPDEPGPREIPRPPPVPDTGEPQPRLIRFEAYRTSDAWGPGIGIRSDSIWAGESAKPSWAWLDVASFPIDVLVSVPNDFNLPKAYTHPGAQLIDGKGGRDLLFRIAQPAKSMPDEPGVYQRDDYSVMVSTGYSTGANSWIEAPIRIFAVPWSAQ